MIAWVEEFRSALDSEFGPRPRVGTLATVDREGRPRARTVVCRKVEDDGSLWVASDARSGKNAEVEHNPAAEMAFWLPSLREQFRVAGSIWIMKDDERRTALWSALSDSARALFFWDMPGAPIVEERGDNPERIPAVAAVPSNFQVLVIRPDLVDHLDLKTHPHRRRRWETGDGWRDRAINP